MLKVIRLTLSIHKETKTTRYCSEQTRTVEVYTPNHESQKPRPSPTTAGKQLNLNLEPSCALRPKHAQSWGKFSQYITRDASSSLVLFIVRYETSSFNKAYVELELLVFQVVQDSVVVRNII